MQSTDVQSFYHGKTVFVTGATGFVGKSLVQRLLQTCDVSTIYVLLRGKRGQDFAERLKSYRSDDVFSTLPDREVKLSKVKAVEGDITLERLGLSDTDYRTLKSSLNIVVHGAATVRFAENLKLATRINVYGTQQVVDLCNQSANMVSLVHMSTLSAWFVKDLLEERVFTMDHLDVEQFIARVQQMDEDEITAITNTYIGEHPKYPNSYMFTKSMAEVLVNQMTAKHVNVAIVRLPLIGCAQIYPYPGWFESLQMHNGLFCAYTTGLIRFSHIPLDIKAQSLPVDHCSNAMITACWDVSLNQPTKPLLVYNAITSDEDSFSFATYQEHAIECAAKYPSIRQLILPKRVTKLSSNFTFFVWCTIAIMAAKLGDVILKVMGKKAILGRMVTKIFAGIDEIAGKCHKFNINTELVNMNIIYEVNLNEADRKTFYYNKMAEINLREYALSLHMNFRRKILKEPDSNLPMARKRLANLYRLYDWLYYFAIGLLAMIMYLITRRFL